MPQLTSAFAQKETRYVYLVGTTNADIIDCYINTGSPTEHGTQFFGTVSWTNCDWTGTDITGYTDDGDPSGGLSVYLRGAAQEVNPTVVPYTAWPHTGDTNFPDWGR